MAKTEIIIYQEQKSQVPLLDWLDGLPSIAQDKCIALVEKLAEMGYELRRPHCDILRDGIYELRARHGNVHYRILYAFIGRNIVLLSHGFTKEKKVPNKEINRAIRNRDSYIQDPEAHTYIGELLL
jgi:phage-related protein